MDGEKGLEGKCHQQLERGRATQCIHITHPHQKNSLFHPFWSFLSPKEKQNKPAELESGALWRWKSGPAGSTSVNAVAVVRHRPAPLEVMWLESLHWIVSGLPCPVFCWRDRPPLPVSEGGHGTSPRLQTSSPSLRLPFHMGHDSVLVRDRG